MEKPNQTPEKGEDFGCSFYPRIVFKDISEVTALRRLIDKRIKQLDEEFEGIQSCSILFECPYRHRYIGNLYNFKIEIEIPGRKIVVTKSPSADGGESNIFAVIRDAFDEVERDLRVQGNEGLSRRKYHRGVSRSEERFEEGRMRLTERKQGHGPHI